MCLTAQLSYQAWSRLYGLLLIGSQVRDTYETKDNLGLSFHRLKESLQRCGCLMDALSLEIQVFSYASVTFD